MPTVINQTEIEKNIDLTFDFLRYLLDNPDQIEEIPNGSVIQFIGIDGSPQLIEEVEQATYYVKVKRQFDLS